MNKLTKVVFLTVMVVSLSGCGKKESVVAVKDGVISNNGVVVDVDEHCLMSASKKLSNGDEITYTTCTGPTSCTHITFQLDDSTLPEYNKNKYATFYFDTETMIWKKTENTFSEAKYRCIQSPAISVDEMLSTLDEGLNTIKLGTYEYAVFNDIVKLNCVGNTVKVRKDEIIIPGSLRISYDTGKITVSDTIIINGKDIGHTSLNGYEYYFYSNVCIQIKAGLDVASLITFL